MSPGAAGSHRIPVGAEGDELVLRWQPAADGAPLAFLYFHGFGSAQAGEKADWFRRRAAEAGLGFCSLDFRGHGESGGRLGALTFSRTLEDAEAALAWLRRRWDGPLVLFGSSMGAAVALWLAARHPGEAASVLAIAPALGMDGAFAERLGEEELGRWRETGVLPFHTELVECELGWDLMDDLARYPAVDLAGRLVTPVLAFQGMRDESVDWHLAVDLAAASGGAAVEVHLFADGDHRLLDLRPRMWEMALSFLAAHGLLSRPA
jgi:alpha-beta hydrolase superfamily lysophospholipase